MVYGYCRVSSKKQLDGNGLEAQKEDILKKYENAIIVEEQYTGTTTDRPELNKLIAEIKENDMIVVNKLDRLARDTRDGINIVEELFKKGASVHVLNVGLLEDTTMGNFFITIMLAVAQMERNIILERTAAGKAIAKKDPNYKEGRPKKYNEAILEVALNSLTVNGGTMSYNQVANKFDISRSTLVRAQSKKVNHIDN